MREERQTPDLHCPPIADASMRMPPLVLASTSVYRRELLSRLGLPFDATAPQTDETPLPGEAPPDLALRLARAKAWAVAQAATTPEDAIVIGSEGSGMTRLVSENCDFLVSIPMKGRISSLNASAAAAILLYEAVRQRS